MDISNDCSLLLQKVLTNLSPDSPPNKRIKKKHITELMFYLSWFSRQDDASEKEVHDAVSSMYNHKLGVKSKAVSL